MKKFDRYFAFVIVCLVCSSCMTTKLVTSNVKATEIADLQLIDPLSLIFRIESGNKGYYNDSLSNISKQYITSYLNSLNGKIPLTGNIFVSDTAIKNKLNAEIGFLFSSAYRPKDVPSIKITPIIDSLLEANQKRFGLIIVTTGYTRAKGNFGKQLAKGAAIGLLTLGWVTPMPYRASSIIYAMIVDSKEKNISFVRRSTQDNLEPLDHSVINNQIKDIFEGYFWTEQ